jgi:hypothetical protein
LRIDPTALSKAEIITKELAQMLVGPIAKREEKIRSGLGLSLQKKGKQ